MICSVNTYSFDLAGMICQDVVRNDLFRALALLFCVLPALVMLQTVHGLCDSLFVFSSVLQVKYQLIDYAWVVIKKERLLLTF